MARFDAFSSDHDSLFNYSKFSPSNGSLASSTMNDSNSAQKFRERSTRLVDIENEKNQLIQVRDEAGYVFHCSQSNVASRMCFFDLMPPKSSLNMSALIMTVKPITIAKGSYEKICCKTSFEKSKP